MKNSVTTMVPRSRMAVYSWQQAEMAYGDQDDQTSICGRGPRCRSYGHQQAAPRGQLRSSPFRLQAALGGISACERPSITGIKL